MAPITIIVRDAKENPKKCSVLPLKGRADIAFFTHPAKALPPLAGYIRLAADGPELSMADRECGILLLDGSWRSAGRMTRDFEHVPPRSLRGWVTAYPRVSKLGSDPDNGLASIEALSPRPFDRRIAGSLSLGRGVFGEKWSCVTSGCWRTL
jgi:pre-rRNA-processing protein TSR3